MNTFYAYDKNKNSLIVKELKDFNQYYYETYILPAIHKSFCDLLKRPDIKNFVNFIDDNFYNAIKTIEVPLDRNLDFTKLNATYLKIAAYNYSIKYNLLVTSFNHFSAFGGYKISSINIALVDYAYDNMLDLHEIRASI